MFVDLGLSILTHSLANISLEYINLCTLTSAMQQGFMGEIQGSAYGQLGIFSVNLRFYTFHTLYECEIRGQWNEKRGWQRHIAAFCDVCLSSGLRRSPLL